MRKIEEVLRPSAQGKSVREISRATGVSRPSVATYLEKATEHQIAWPLPEGMDAKALEQLFFGAGDTPKPTPGLPDWEKVATELATHQHLTLQLLWLEYKEQNPEGLSESEIWHLYMTLTRVEEAFRALKSDLGLRPVYHQLARRTSAHLFISVLAYHLYGAIAYELSTKGDTRRPSTILERLTTHMRAIATLTDDKRKVHHIRISTTPDPEQRKIFESLGILTPYRGELR